MKLGEGDGGGDGDVEGVGVAEGIGRGDEERAGGERLHLRTGTVALGAHQDECRLGEIGREEILAVEIEDAEGDIGIGADKFREIAVDELHIGESAHCALYGLGVIDISRLAGCENTADTEPGGRADYRAEIAGVLDAVKEEGQIFRGKGQR